MGGVAMSVVVEVSDIALEVDGYCGGSGGSLAVQMRGRC